MCLSIILANSVVGGRGLVLFVKLTSWTGRWTRFGGLFSRGLELKMKFGCIICIGSSPLFGSPFFGGRPCPEKGANSTVNLNSVKSEVRSSGKEFFFFAGWPV